MVGAQTSPSLMLPPPPLHEPLEQVFAAVHAVALSQTVPLLAWLELQVPLPLQVSGLVHALLVLLPHEVPAEAWLALQVPF